MQASCQCGALTAEISDDAEPTVVVCHCIDCQRRSGSQFGSIAYYARESVTITGKAEEFSRGTDSGNVFTTGFCPTCGSTVFARPSFMPQIVGVTVGTFADPAFPPPVRSVYEQSRHDWITIPETTSRHLRGRDS